MDVGKSHVELGFYWKQIFCPLGWRYCLSESYHFQLLMSVRYIGLCGVVSCGHGQIYQLSVHG